MTLVAGINCNDGFIIAADTEITHGEILFQGHKLDLYGKSHEDYRVAIAFAGDVAYARMASRQIRDVLSELTAPTLQDIKATIADVTENFYARHIFKYWSGDSLSDAPHFSLVVGAEGADRKWGVFATNNTVTQEVDAWVFDGSGSPLAEFLASRLLTNRHSDAVPTSTAATMHIIKQIFRAVKTAGVFVGGNTELVAHRINDEAERFFDLTGDMGSNAFYMWGIDLNLIAAIRAALTPGTTTMLDAHIKKVELLLQALAAEAARDRPPATRTLRSIEMPNNEWQSSYIE